MSLEGPDFISPPGPGFSDLLQSTLCSDRKTFFYKPLSLQERLDQPLSINSLTCKSQNPLIGGQNPREKKAKSDGRSNRSLCCRMLSRAWLMDAPFWPLITANAFWALFLHHVLLSIPSRDSQRQVLAFCTHKVYDTQGRSRLPKSQVCTYVGVGFPASKHMSSIFYLHPGQTPSPSVCPKQTHQRIT